MEEHLLIRDDERRYRAQQDQQSQPLRHLGELVDDGRRPEQHGERDFEQVSDVPEKGGRRRENQRDAHREDDLERQEEGEEQHRRGRRHMIPEHHERQEDHHREEILRQIEEDRSNRKNRPRKEHALQQAGIVHDRSRRHGGGTGKERPREQPEHQGEDESFASHPQDHGEGHRVDDHHQEGIGERPEEAEHRSAVFQLDVFEDQVLQQLAIAIEAAHGDCQRRHFLGVIDQVADRRACVEARVRPRSERPRAPPPQRGDRQQDRVSDERAARNPLESR